MTPARAALLCLLAGASSARAAPFTRGNVLVVEEQMLYEFTPAGVQVQAIPVPLVGDDGARDVIVDANGEAFVFNGTFNPFLSRYDPVLDAWTHDTEPTWSTVNNITYGGVARFGDAAFVTDMNTFSRGDTGILRFDVTTGAPTRFLPGLEPIDLTLGFDGVLYALTGNFFNTIHRIDPATMAVLGTIPVGPRDVRGLAVNAAGTIFAADWNGRIHELDGAGASVRALDPGFNSLDDLDIDGAGNLVATARSGEVVLTDEGLAGFTSFALARYPGYIFAAFTDPSPPSGCAPGPGVIAGLKAARQANDVHLEWNADAGSGGGYHGYRTALKSDLPASKTVGLRVLDSAAGSTAGDDLDAVPGPPGTVHFYQLVGVCLDGVTEGAL